MRSPMSASNARNNIWKFLAANRKFARPARKRRPVQRNNPWQQIFTRAAMGPEARSIRREILAVTVRETELGSRAWAPACS